MSNNNVDWGKCVDVCTDRGKSMAGKLQAAQPCIQAKTTYVVWPRCIIYRETLPAENFNKELQDVL